VRLKSTQVGSKLGQVRQVLLGDEMMVWCSSTDMVRYDMVRRQPVVMMMFSRGAKSDHKYE
jgi:hypothetical protein